MILVDITKKDDLIQDIVIKGHSGYADYGYDIVCSAVSALTIGIINGIQEVVGIEGLQVKEVQDQLSISSRKIIDPEAITISQYFLKTLVLALEDISKEYPENLKIRENQKSL